MLRSTSTTQRSPVPRAWLLIHCACGLAWPGLLRTLLPDHLPDSLSRAARDHALTRVIRARLVFAPVLGTVALGFAFAGDSLWRRALLCTVVVMFVSLSTIEFVRHRRHGLDVVMVRSACCYRSSGS